LQFVFNQYFKALIMIALSTVVFIAVNNLVSTLPEGLVISPQGARVVSTTSTTTSTGTTTTTGGELVNITIYDQFNYLSNAWVNLSSFDYYVSDGVLYVKSSNSWDDVLVFTAVNNASKYEQIYIEVKCSASYSVTQDIAPCGLVVLSSDLRARIYAFAIVNTYASAAGYGHGFYQNSYYDGVLVSHYESKYLSTIGVFNIKATIVRVNSTAYQLDVTYEYTDKDVVLASYSRVYNFPVQVDMDYVGVAVRPYSASRYNAFHYFIVKLTHSNATSEISIEPSATYPQEQVCAWLGCSDCPECPECPCMEGEVYIPLRLMGQFIAFTSYILFIVTALKNIMPEL
jgi:hypothetical protein